MKKYSKITPEGSRDYLFEECDDRRQVERVLAELFKENEYRKVITPSIEFFDVFESHLENFYYVFVGKRIKNFFADLSCFDEFALP